jgi:hypothetical protein
VLPVVTLAARFNVRGVIAGSSGAGVLIVSSSFGVDPAQVIASPQEVVFRLALLGAVALLSLALMRSDLQYRNASVIDPLTSMLNRNALGLRVEELRHQARIVQQPIVLIIADIDRFKAVNDAHGTPSVTRYYATSRTRCASACARLTWPTGWGARSSWCCFPVPMPARPLSSLRACARRSLPHAMEACP